MEVSSCCGRCVSIELVIQFIGSMASFFFFSEKDMNMNPCEWCVGGLWGRVVFGVGCLGALLEEEGKKRKRALIVERGERESEVQDGIIRIPMIEQWLNLIWNNLLWTNPTKTSLPLGTCCASIITARSLASGPWMFTAERG